MIVPFVGKTDSEAQIFRWIAGLNLLEPLQSIFVSGHQAVGVLVEMTTFAVFEGEELLRVMFDAETAKIAETDEDGIPYFTGSVITSQLGLANPDAPDVTTLQMHQRLYELFQ